MFNPCKKIHNYLRDSWVLKPFHYKYQIQHSILANLFYVKGTLSSNFMSILNLILKNKHIDKDVGKVKLSCIVQEPVNWYNLFGE